MEKILVFGDSIVYGKWDHQGGWVARLREYIDGTYNIGRGGNIQVYNLGIPGEVAPRLAERFATELRYRIIHPEHQNLVVIGVGANDSCPNNWMTEQKTPKKEFQGALRSMITTAKEAGCTVILLGLKPVNPSKSKGLLFSDECILEYDGYITEVAQEMQVQKIELFHKLQALQFAELLVDSVHPNDEGHQILFEEILSIVKDKIDKVR